MANMIEVIETTIGVMFESLADSATPVCSDLCQINTPVLMAFQVRLAASKALSLITLKLPPEMATQVVDEVIASLMRDVSIITQGHRKTQDL